MKKGPGKKAREEMGSEKSRGPGKQIKAPPKKKGTENKNG